MPCGNVHERHNGDAVLEDGVFDGGWIIGGIMCGFGGGIHFCDNGKTNKKFQFSSSLSSASVTLSGGDLK